MSRASETDSRFAQLEAYVVASVREMFDAHGRALEREDDGPIDASGSSVMSVIGFAADGLRGSLMMLSPRETVIELVPGELRRPGIPLEHALRDVLGEFANMLAGRVKNHLLTHGVEPLVSTPTTVLGDILQVPPSASGTSAWYRFAGRDTVLFVRLDATFEVGFMLAPADAEKAPPVREGEMILF